MKVKMKTGLEMSGNELPETFYILLFGFDAILKRASFKDAAHFKTHNPNLVNISSELFASSVAFNLQSDYGLGKKLQPLILELFKTLWLDPDKYEKNIFFEEVVRLSPIILSLLRKTENRDRDEVLWTYSYAIESLNRTDALSVERMERLIPLFLDFSSDSERDEREREDEICECLFCTEFSRFHVPRSEYAEKLILNALLEIDSMK